MERTLADEVGGRWRAVPAGVLLVIGFQAAYLVGVSLGEELTSVMPRTIQFDVEGSSPEKREERAVTMMGL